MEPSASAAADSELRSTAAVEPAHAVHPPADGDEAVTSLQPQLSFVSLCVFACSPLLVPLLVRMFGGDGGVAEHPSLPTMQYLFLNLETPRPQSVHSLMLSLARHLL